MTELETQIEALLDKHGAHVFLCALSNVAYGKADHLHINWQDEGAAMLWSRLGRRIDGVADWAKERFA